MASLDYLKEAHRNGNLVPVVGAGFSAATARLPSWPGLVDLGTSYLRRELTRRVTIKQIRAVESVARSGDLPTAFDALQQLMSQEGREHHESLHYQGFLNEVFHDAPVESTTLADALRSLRPRVVLTTNYDRLLEDTSVSPGTQSATWLKPADIRSLLRSGSGVVHLHGRYDVPSSVILSRSDYQRLVDDRDAVAVAQAIFHSGVLLFLGTSIGGLEDPHMGKILSEFAAMTDRTRGEDSPHVALLAGRQSGKEIAQLRQLGIEAVSYGNDHADLPAFLTQITERERIVVESYPVRALTQAIGKAGDKGEALTQIVGFIQNRIFPGRNVRITFCEKVSTADSGQHLEARHVMPVNATRNVFNYPLSIAAWALIEGRIISWPEDRKDRCNFDLIDRLGRLEDVFKLLSAPAVESVPEITRYVDLTKVRERFVDRTLSLGDFFQDWASDQPDPRYDRFLSVPVPAIDSFGNRERIPEFGVFNIDALGGGPLLDRRSHELLQLVSALATLVYFRFG
ncbi:SIR2 family protein [Actinoplanes sp. CA-131856]